MANDKPRVLLVNDDGPPGKDSPYVFGLYLHFTRNLGWDVKVVVPSSQMSWIGKAYRITEVTKGRYYYPQEPHGIGETSPTSRALKEGEVGEWVLLDGTPATCANIGFHNIYPGQIDLVISGPNLGRNTSSAFSLSSGTIGAALSASLSGVRSIALSYGTVIHPTPSTLFDPAHKLSCRIIQHLWGDWGKDPTGLRNGEIDLYSINIPMIEQLLSEEGLRVCWTHMWRNTYGQMFKAVELQPEAGPSVNMASAGPDSLDQNPSGSQKPGLNSIVGKDIGNVGFKFSPNLRSIIEPSLSSLPVGTDGWVLGQGWVCVTPLRASFAEAPIQGKDPHVVGNIEERFINLKL